jgi:hypothetical protein
MEFRITGETLRRRGTRLEKKAKSRPESAEGAESAEGLAGAVWLSAQQAIPAGEVARFGGFLG